MVGPGSKVLLGPVTSDGEFRLLLLSPPYHVAILVRCVFGDAACVLCADATYEH